MDNKNTFHVILNNNYSKLWTITQNYYVKGYAFFHNELLEGVSLGEFIRESIKKNFLDKTLYELNGTFSAIIVFEDNAYLIADKVRSLPLVYGLGSNGVWQISDGSTGLLNNCEIEKKLDSLSEAEFLALGFISGNNTLYNNISSLNAGEYAILNLSGQVERKKYFQYFFPKKNINRSELYDMAYQKLELSFSRTIESLPQESQIVIPLSGGYDSRLIACLCKKHNMKNVICYTYGRKDSFEVSISKKVADQLGFDWFYVEYTPENFVQSLLSPSFQQFATFTSNCECIPHVQDFLALLELKRKEIINKSAVVIPGFCGDVFGGSKIPREVFSWLNPQFSTQEIVKLIYRHFYDLNELIKPCKKQVLKKLTCEFNGRNISTEDSFLNNYEQWCIENRLSKYIINSLRVYEYFGMDWRMPLWDDEYAKLWYTIPWREKNAELLNEFMFNRYFIPMNVDFLKPHARNSQKKMLSFVKHLMPQSLYYYIRNLYYKTLSKGLTNDVNCFVQASRDLTISLNSHSKIIMVKKWRIDNIMAVMARYEIMKYLK